ncbi:MAG: carbon monoxide dehydrogenase subunit G [Pseudomonadota bacterium]
MKLSGDQFIPVPRETVWDALNDANVLRQSVPGCQALEGSIDDGFTATAVAKIGPVKATFTGEISISDIVVGESYTLRGEGKGGVAGFARGQANVTLSDDTQDGQEGTRLTYDVEASVGGKLAQIGGRLVDAAAKKLADEFFRTFKATLEHS